MSTYTLDAGRCIVRDGTPIATIHGVGNYDPGEIDALARTMVRLLANTDELISLFRDTLGDNQVNAIIDAYYAREQLK